MDSPGIYSVKVSSESPCFHEFIDSINLNLKGWPPSFLDSTICEGKQIELLSPSNSYSQLWSTGEITANIQVDQSDLYYVDYIVEGCPSRDSFSILIENAPVIELASDTILCEGDIMELSIDGIENYNIDSLIWSTGEHGNTIQVSTPGLYSVELIRHGECPLNLEKEFIISLIEAGTELNDTTVCNEAELELSVNVQSNNYLWSTGERTQSITIMDEGIYSVSWQLENCFFSDTIEVVFEANIDIEIIGKDYLCPGDTIILSIGSSDANPDVSILWSNFETTESINIDQPGIYSVQVNPGNHCVTTDSINISAIPRIDLPLIIDTILCGQEELWIDLSDIEGYSNIDWHDGFSGHSRAFSRGGEYPFTVMTSCEEVEINVRIDFLPYSSENLPIYIPNAFTPNDDGVNDVFKAEIADDFEIEKYYIAVFDRWGNRVFESFDPKEAWDGSFKGIPMDPAIFVYYMRIEAEVCKNRQQIERSGDLNLQK